MQHKNKRAVIAVGIAVPIAVAVVAVLNGSHKPSSIVLDVPLEPAPSTRGSFMTPSPVAYWADDSHVVACVQSAAASSAATIVRRSFVYEVPSGRHWRLPALDTVGPDIILANSPWSYVTSEGQMNYIGMSSDHKRLYADLSGYWCSTPVLNLSKGVVQPKCKWRVHRSRPILVLFYTSAPHQVTSHIPPGSPITDNFVGMPIQSVSPDGRHVAWVDFESSHTPVQRIRQFLSRWRISRSWPKAALWISDIGGSHPRCVETFGDPSTAGYDLRWSPNGKHLSCASESLFSDAKNIGKTYRLTVFNASP